MPRKKKEDLTREETGLPEDGAMEECVENEHAECDTEGSDHLFPEAEGADFIETAEPVAFDEFAAPADSYALAEPAESATTVKPDAPLDIAAPTAICGDTLDEYPPLPDILEGAGHDCESERDFAGEIVVFGDVTELATDFSEYGSRDGEREAENAKSADDAGSTTDIKNADDSENDEIKPFAEETLPGETTDGEQSLAAAILPAPVRKKTIRDLDLSTLDKNLSDEQRREWNAIYASYRSKSVLSGTVVGVDQTSFDVRSRESGGIERKTLSSLIIIGYRVKVLIPESEIWMPGDERPNHVMRNMVGSEIDYAVIEVDREGECAIASRRVALAAKRHFFAREGHKEGDTLKCRVLAVGPKQCTVECGGFDIRLTQRDLSYAAIADLRETYRPGQELPCRLLSYDAGDGRIGISVKDVNPNPFIGADLRHPIGCRRQAKISGKYGGGVFCTLPDDTVCLCLYSAQHADSDFGNGDGVIVVIRQYDYQRQLIYGKILAKW